MEGFEKNIKRWVTIDNEVKQLNESLKKLRDEKESLTHGIIAYANDNKMTSSIIRIGDGDLKFATTRVTPSLTLKHVETCLTELIQNKDQVNRIMEHIKNKRDVKMVPEIKRSFRKSSGDENA